MADLSIVFVGLSVTSSWGNGHATNYRALMRCLHEAGHRVTFLERDVPWYAQQRDLPDPPWGSTHLYGSLDELRRVHSDIVRAADAVIVGSYVPDGVAVGEWVCDTTEGVTAFYDIDTPVTLAKLEADDTEYLSRELVGRFDVYLSFTGGPTLQRLEEEFGARRARAFYCMVDATSYYPEDVARRWDLGYLGTYSDDRQPTVDELLLAPARRLDSGRFVVAGPQYPDEIDWPGNVERIEHLPPPEHRGFYNAQRFTLNITRAHMVAAGYSPSVRLFEAAACGVPVISDRWAGIEEFFKPGTEILLADDRDDVVRYLEEVSDEERAAIGRRARDRVRSEHTAETRTAELLEHIAAARRRRRHGQGLTLQSLGTAAGDEDDIARTINSLAPWFHNLHLPSGHQTAPDHPLGDYPTYKWRQIGASLPPDLDGWTVLDIGCNAGAYAVGVAQRGAQVLAIDHDEHYLHQARWAAEQFGVADRIEFQRMGVYDLADLDQSFDLVLFLGVLYHLRYPLLALDLVAQKAQRMLVVQTLSMPGRDVVETPADLSIDDRDAMLAPGWPMMAFIEHQLEGDATNWWAPNRAAMEAMLRSTGMQVVERPGPEIYVCEPDGGVVVDRTELNAAVHRTRTSGTQ